ncbi:8063_t:CDS:1, partial [Paraglomus occultum]
AIFLPTAHNPNPNETASDIQEPVVASTQHMIVETVEVETVTESKESSVFSKIKSVFAGIGEDIKEISRDSDSSRRLCRRSEVEFSMTNPPYAINNGGKELSLSYRTSPMDAYHHNGEFEYDAHNLFGHMEAQTTYRSLRKIRPNKRPFLLSRSTFPSSGRYVAHWLGDNASTWEDLQYSIPGILSFQLFCIPLTGADLCGFNDKCNEELAMRWVELGSFYPFCRNHNVIGMPSQEVYSWESVEKVARKYIGLRYALLPYWYTAFYRSSTKGTPVLRPLWASYPEDKETYNIEHQFLIHDGILISPVLEAEKKE